MGRGRRPALKPDQQGALIARWVAGESVARLAVEFGISDRTVQRILAEVGLRAAHRITPAPGARSGPPCDFSGTGGGQATPRPHFREEFAALGPPPDDPVEAGEYLYRGLMLTFRQAGMDEAYDRDPAGRRREMVSIARAAAGCLPTATIARTVRLIQADAEERDGAGGGPEEEELSAEDVTSGAHRAAPRRGRSAKR